MASALSHKAWISTGLPMRGDNPVTDLHVHPGELDAGLASREQPIRVDPHAVARALVVAIQDTVDRLAERLLLGLAHPHLGLVCGFQVVMHGNHEPQGRVHRVVPGASPSRGTGWAACRGFGAGPGVQDVTCELDPARDGSMPRSVIKVSRPQSVNQGYPAKMVRPPPRRTM